MSIKPYYQTKLGNLYYGKCELICPELELTEKVGACVTDPPYGLRFMGKKWDYQVPSVEIWKAILDILKPGAHLLSFAGTRTQHRMACNIEDAGFEIKDMLAWHFGSGFPKSTRVNRDPRFCQCGVLGHNAENKNRAQQQEDHTCMEIDANDDDLLRPDAHHLKNTALDYQDCCLKEVSACDEHALSEATDGQSFLPLSERVQGHTHFDELVDGLASESSHNPCLVQCNAPPSSLDSYHQKGVVSFSNNPLNNKHADILKSSPHKSDNSQGLSFGTSYNKHISYTSGFPSCQVCGKPNAGGWGSALKPAWECLTMAQKSLTTCSDFDITLAKLIYKFKEILCQYPLFVQIVEKNLKLNQKGLNVDVNIAQWIAEKNINIPEDLSVLMVTLQSESATSLNLNIVLFWLNILADLWGKKSILTILMETNLTIDLQILGLSEWENIFRNIIQVKDNKTNGQSASVLIVANIFNGLRSKLEIIQERSVQGTVISKAGAQGLRPNLEPITLARKPILGTIAQNVLDHGVGGINIDECRINVSAGDENIRDYTNHIRKTGSIWGNADGVKKNLGEKGRWPANVIFTHHPECEMVGMKKVKAISGGNIGFKDNKIYSAFGESIKGNPGYGYTDGTETVESWICHTDCPIKILDEQSGERKAGGKITDGANSEPTRNVYGKYNRSLWESYKDTGSASRFFYCAKASRSERGQGNNHPTVKPIALMKYLITLVCPPNEILIDPFGGSGSTALAAEQLNIKWILIEKDEESCEIAAKRIEKIPKTQINLF